MIKYLFIALVVTAVGVDAQFVRHPDVPTDILLSHTDRQGLFEVAKNPAGVLPDIEQNYFSLAPEYGTADQAYRRLYDPAHTEYAAVNTQIARVLSESGTFFGTASFRREQRGDVRGSLRSDPYQGDPFFVSDTFNGNFTYSGPEVGFAYAYDAGGDVLIGIDASYGILDGLKDTYTRAHSVNRNFSTGAGVAYSLSPRSLVGVTARLFSEQEKIESKSDDGLDVEIFSYRGDYLSTRRRGVTIEETFRTKGYELSAEAVACPVPRMKFIAQMKLRDRSLTGLHGTASLLDFEDGFAHERGYTADAVVRYKLSALAMPFARLVWTTRELWAKNSERNLLLWEWKARTTTAAAGLILNFGGDTYLRVEGVLTSENVDSTKYISGIAVGLSPSGSGARAELHAPIVEGLTCLWNVGYGGTNRDVVIGGTDLTSVDMCASLTYNVTDVLSVTGGYAYRHLQAFRGDVKKTAEAQSVSISLHLVQE